MAAKVALVGNVIANPQSRAQNNGNALTCFQVRTVTRVGGGRESAVHSIVTFGRTADSCRDFLKIGMAVFIDGRLKYTNGKAEVVGERVEFLADELASGERAIDLSDEPDGKNYRAEDWRS